MDIVVELVQDSLLDVVVEEVTFEDQLVLVTDESAISIVHA